MGEQAVHVYAPKSHDFAASNYNCDRPDRNGNPCGSLRALVEAYEWHSPTVTCCACGDRISEGCILPREHDLKRVRDRWAKATPLENRHG